MMRPSPPSRTLGASRRCSDATRHCLRRAPSGAALDRSGAASSPRSRAAVQPAGARARRKPLARGRARAGLGGLGDRLWADSAARWSPHTSRSASGARCSGCKPEMLMSVRRRRAGFRSDARVRAAGALLHRRRHAGVARAYEHADSNALSRRRARTRALDLHDDCDRRRSARRALSTARIAAAIGLRETFVLAGGLCVVLILRNLGASARSCGRYEKKRVAKIATRLNNSAGTTPCGVMDSSN